MVSDDFTTCTSCKFTKCALMVLCTIVTANFTTCIFCMCCEICIPHLGSKKHDFTFSFTPGFHLMAAWKAASWVAEHLVQFSPLSGQRRSNNLSRSGLRSHNPAQCTPELLHFLTSKRRYTEDTVQRRMGKMDDVHISNLQEQALLNKCDLNNVDLLDLPVT